MLQTGFRSVTDMRTAHQREIMGVIFPELTVPWFDPKPPIQLHQDAQTRSTTRRPLSDLHITSRAGLCSFPSNVIKSIYSIEYQLQVFDQMPTVPLKRAVTDLQIRIRLL